MSWQASLKPLLTQIPAGGGAYYFAKKQIHADRQSKLEEHRRKRHEQQSYEYSGQAPSEGHGVPNKSDTAGSPSFDAADDPAPTQHPPAKDDDSQRTFQSKVPYKSTKGDRFS